MNESVHTEAVQTDLPSAKPNRRKRLASGLVVLAVGITVIVMVYQLNRPPGDARFTSSIIDNFGHRVSILIPAGWTKDNDIDPGSNYNGMYDPLVAYSFR